MSGGIRHNKNTGPYTIPKPLENAAHYQEASPADIHYVFAGVHYTASDVHFSR